MDAKEIFKQLTCGAVFTKPIASKLKAVRHSNSEIFRRTNHGTNFFFLIPKSIQQSISTLTSIKKEVKEENVSIESDVSIKSECGSDNEGENSAMQMLSDSAMPILMSKKKKKVTPEQLKNWETEKVCVPVCHG